MTDDQSPAGAAEEGAVAPPPAVEDAQPAQPARVRKPAAPRVRKPKAAPAPEAVSTDPAPAPAEQAPEPAPEMIPADAEPEAPPAPKRPARVRVRKPKAAKPDAPAVPAEDAAVDVSEAGDALAPAPSETDAPTADPEPLEPQESGGPQADAETPTPTEADGPPVDSEAHGQESSDAPETDAEGPAPIAVEASDALLGASEADTVDLPAEDAPVPVSEPAEAASEESVAAPVVDAEAPAGDGQTKRPARRSRSRKPRTAVPDAGDHADPASVDVPIMAESETAAGSDVVAGDPEAAPATEESEAPVAGVPAPRKRPSRRSRSRGGDKGGEKAAPIAEPAEPGELESREDDVPAPAAVPARGKGRQRVKPAEPVADVTGARVVVRRGLPELQIDGQAVPHTIFFGNLSGPGQEKRVVAEVQRAAKAGVHIHSTLIELTCPLPPEDTVYETIDHRITTLLDADPKGYVLPRVMFVPAAGWRSQYPNEVNHYADGTTDDPSIASDRFWEEAENALRSLIEHVQRTSYGSRVIGYHLERGEWFHPERCGYDRSFANREAFRRWLRTKYKGSEVALRAAWHDGAIQFYTSEIPPMPPASRPEQAFFEARRGRQWIDFLEFTSDTMADRLIQLARCVKEATDHSALVSVCYGYTFEFSHTYSGHLALDRLVSATSIDIISGPPSYSDRRPGRGGFFPSPIDSVIMHGKLWLSEDDTRTHLAGADPGEDDYNPRMETRQATEAVHLRSMGIADAHQTALGWMDLWGDGWLAGDEIWQRIAAHADLSLRFGKTRRAESPDVVVLVSERSLFHVQRGAAFVRRILQGQRESIARTGAKVGIYLDTDIASRSFPTDARVYVFLNPYRLSAPVREAIREKLQSGGKTLVFTYAVGTCGERGEVDDSSNELMGMSIRQQSWNAEVGSRIADTRDPITAGLRDRSVGERERLNPSFFVDDDQPGVVTLAEYQQSGLPSIAVRRSDGWTSVFCGEPVAPTELFRSIFKAAGVRMLTSGEEEYVYSGYGWVTIHALRDGQRTLSVPADHGVYDLAEGRLVADDLGTCRVMLRANTTRRFFVGTREEMRRLGLEWKVQARTESDPDPEAEVTFVPPDAPVAVPAAAAEPEADAEDLFEAALAEGGPTDEDGDDDGADGEAVPGESAEATERRRSRRRRGGRGRGRRRRAEGEGGAAPPPPAPEG